MCSIASSSLSSPTLSLEVSIFYVSLSIYLSMNMNASLVAYPNHFLFIQRLAPQMTPFSDLLPLLLRLRRPLLRRAATWTAFMTAAVVLSSFTPELAFVWALSHPHTAGGARCRGDLVWVPLDSEGACLPPRALNRSTADVFVPPVFAALVVGASACFVRAVTWGRSRGVSEDLRQMA